MEYSSGVKLSALTTLFAHLHTASSCAGSLIGSLSVCGIPGNPPEQSIRLFVADYPEVEFSLLPLSMLLLAHRSNNVEIE